MVDHLQNSTRHTLRIEREQAEHHKAKVADGGIRNQLLDIRLSVGNCRAVNDADVKMATTFYIIKRLVPMGTRGVIQDEQVKWLQLRDQCGHSIRCLSEVYQMRQQKLDIYMARIYEQGPF